MTNLALIPVRGGSKGLPRKNALPVMGEVSLLEWTIRQVQASCLSDAIVVSTEDDELAHIARRCGVEVAHRPQALAKDETTTASVVEHLLEDDSQYDEVKAITILQATSPLRRSEDIDAAAALFETGDYDSVVSGCVYEGIHPAKLYYAENSEVQSVTPKFETCRRQDLPEIYRRNGAIFMVTRKHFEETSRLWGGKTGMLKMPIERSVDVDTQTDLDSARAYLNNQEGAA